MIAKPCVTTQNAAPIGGGVYQIGVAFGVMYKNWRHVMLARQRKGHTAIRHKCHARTIGAVHGIKGFDALSFALQIGG